MRGRLLRFAISFLLLGSVPHGHAETKVIHEFVALCDNRSQGIVPVSAKIGNGDDPTNNLYWGCADGLKTVFERSPDWKSVTKAAPPRRPVIERCVFRHQTRDVWLIAHAYRGSEIKSALEDFFASASGCLQ